MKSIKSVIIVLCYLFALQSCYAQKENSKELKEITTTLIERLYEKENLSSITFDSKQYFHCKFQSLNDDFYLINVVMSSYRPLKPVCQNLNVKDIEVFVYAECKSKPILPNESNSINPFFVPDSKFWSFLISTKGERIMIKQLVYYNVDDNSVPDDLKW